jgi:hypothetical protein
MSARSEYRAAKLKLEAEALVTILAVTVTAPDGTSVTEAWPRSLPGTSVEDVMHSDYMLDELSEMTACAWEQLEYKVLGYEPAPTLVEAAEDSARREVQRLDHVARCQELGIDPDDRRAKFMLLQAMLGEG